MTFEVSKQNSGGKKEEKAAFTQCYWMSHDCEEEINESYQPDGTNQMLRRWRLQNTDRKTWTATETGLPGPEKHVRVTVTQTKVCFESTFKNNQI